MKYIIKNCPAFNEDYNECCGKGAKFIYCMDNTNCILKQIVNICNEAIEDYDKEKFYDDDVEFFLGADSLAHIILEKFEIKDIEE